VFRDYFDCEVYHVGQSQVTTESISSAIVKDEPFLIQVKRRTKSTATEGLESGEASVCLRVWPGKENQGAVVTTAKNSAERQRSWAKTPRLADISFKISTPRFCESLSMVNCVASKWRSATLGGFQGVDGPAPSFRVKRAGRLSIS
jgi:hypothetical protein